MLDGAPVFDPPGGHTSNCTPMKQISEIVNDYVGRYFAGLDDAIKTGYIQAVQILSEFISDTVEEENRIILKGLSDELFGELRVVAASSYSFDIFGERKSFFDNTGGAGCLIQNTGYRFTKALRVCGMI